jgi:hypothetical protein
VANLITGAHRADGFDHLHSPIGLDVDIAMKIQDPLGLRVGSYRAQKLAQ